MVVLSQARISADYWPTNWPDLTWPACISMLRKIHVSKFIESNLFIFSWIGPKAKVNSQLHLNEFLQSVLPSANFLLLNSTPSGPFQDAKGHVKKFWKRTCGWRKECGRVQVIISVSSLGNACYIYLEVRCVLWGWSSLHSLVSLYLEISQSWCPTFWLLFLMEK